MDGVSPALWVHVSPLSHLRAGLLWPCAVIAKGCLGGWGQGVTSTVWWLVSMEVGRAAHVTMWGPWGLNHWGWLPLLTGPVAHLQAWPPPAGNGTLVGVEGGACGPHSGTPRAAQPLSGARRLSLLCLQLSLPSLHPFSARNGESGWNIIQGINFLG